MILVVIPQTILGKVGVGGGNGRDDLAGGWEDGQMGGRVEGRVGRGMGKRMNRWVGAGMELGQDDGMIWRYAINYVWANSNDHLPLPNLREEAVCVRARVHVVCLCMCVRAVASGDAPTGTTRDIS